MSCLYKWKLNRGGNSIKTLKERLFLGTLADNGKTRDLLGLLIIPEIVIVKTELDSNVDV